MIPDQCRRRCLPLHPAPLLRWGSVHRHPTLTAGRTRPSGQEGLFRIRRRMVGAFTSYGRELHSDSDDLRLDVVMNSPTGCPHFTSRCTQGPSHGNGLITLLSVFKKGMHLDLNATSAGSTPVSARGGCPGLRSAILHRHGCGPNRRWTPLRSAGIHLRRQPWPPKFSSIHGRFFCRRHETWIIVKFFKYDGDHPWFSVWNERLTLLD